jgi:protein-tyrosine-phosphatase
MAEGFARRYGSDVLTASSAGLAPLPSIVGETVEIMAEKGIDVSAHVPRFFLSRETDSFDIIVNMSGMPLPGVPPRELLVWDVNDPYRQKREVYRATRDDIENRVMRLILQLRRQGADQTRRGTHE